jgi:hypothetical protein
MNIRFAFCTAILLSAAEAAAQQGATSQQEAAPNPQTSQPSTPPAGQVPQLPPVTVITPKEEQAPKPKVKPGLRARAPAGAPASGTTPRIPATQPSTAQAAQTGAGQNPNGVPAQLAKDVNNLNAARENILPKIGVNTYDVNRDTIEALPQGDNAPLDKVLLQTPGVYQDSAASGNLHIRNEHANLQYRINGIQLPDGVAGFGQVLETSLIENMSVVTGALPAQYGLRTAGLVDIQTRTGITDPWGQISVYGGSHGNFTSDRKSVV